MNAGWLKEADEIASLIARDGEGLEEVRKGKRDDAKEKKKRRREERDEEPQKGDNQK